MAVRYPEQRAIVVEWLGRVVRGDFEADWEFGDAVEDLDHLGRHKSGERLDDLFRSQTEADAVEAAVTVLLAVSDELPASAWPAARSHPKWAEVVRLARGALEALRD